jgi:uncharacterized protein
MLITSPYNGRTGSSKPQPPRCGGPQNTETVHLRGATDIPKQHDLTGSIFNWLQSLALSDTVIWRARPYSPMKSSRLEVKSLRCVPKWHVDREAFRRGALLFNSGYFFEAHEVWEDVWRPLPASPEKMFLQGVIQIAVACHHHATGNRVGALSLLARALRNLAAFPPDFGGIDLAGLLREVADCRGAWGSASSAAALPRVRLLGE